MNSGARLPAARSAGAGLLALRSIGYEPVGVVVGIQLGRPQPGDSQLSATAALSRRYGLAPGPGGYMGANQAPQNALSTYPCPDGEVSHPIGYNSPFLSNLYYQARAFDSALRQLLVQVRQLGAQGVIGVQVEEERIELTKGRADHASKWTLTGTAVRHVGAPPAEPFSTSMNEAELVVLHQTGHRPTRMTLGLGTVWVALGCEANAALNSAEPADVVQLADAYRQASDLAHQEVMSQAQAVGADQVINIRTLISRPAELAFGGRILCRMIGDAVTRTGRRRPTSISVALPVDPPRPPGPPRGSPTAFDLEILASLDLQPTSPVAGAAVVQLRMARYNRDPAGEIASLSQSLARARGAAIARIQEAAASTGASGVIDVQMDVDWVPWSRSFLLSVTLRGVALAPRSRGAATSGGSKPVLATLTAEELLILDRSGWKPVGLAAGIAVFNRSWTPAGTLSSSIWSGGEAKNVTEAIYGAREVALERLAEMARTSGADGVLGIKISTSPTIWGRRAIEMSAVGTSVAAVGGHKRMPPVDLMLTLAESPAGLGSGPQASPGGSKRRGRGILAPQQ